MRLQHVARQRVINKCCHNFFHYFFLQFFFFTSPTPCCRVSIKLSTLRRTHVSCWKKMYELKTTTTLDNCLPLSPAAPYSSTCTVKVKELKFFCEIRWIFRFRDFFSVVVASSDAVVFFFALFFGCLPALFLLQYATVKWETLQILLLYCFRCLFFLMLPINFGMHINLFCLSLSLLLFILLLIWNGKLGALQAAAAETWVCDWYVLTFGLSWFYSMLIRKQKEKKRQ